MNTEDKERAQRLFRVLAGAQGKDSDFQRLAKGAANFAEFRIRLVVDGPVRATAPVAAAWRAHVKQRAAAPDTNELMHTLEQLAARQTALERQLRERDAELLDRLRQLDTLTTGQGELRKEAAQVRELIVKYRQAVLKLAELTS